MFPFFILDCRQLRENITTYQQVKWYTENKTYTEPFGGFPDKLMKNLQTLILFPIWLIVEELDQ
jgi:hypothetical protein